MVKHEISEDQIDADLSAVKPIKVDTPSSTPPMVADSVSTTDWPKSVTAAAEPPKTKTISRYTPPVATGPPPPTSDLATKSEIEIYFEYHFNKKRVYASAEDKRHPDQVPDYHISSNVLVRVLTNLSAKALKHFQDEYLDDVYVFIDRLDQFKEFAPLALRFPRIGGRIKLDSRNVYDPVEGKMPAALASEEEQKKLVEKVEKLKVWEEDIRKVVALVGEEMGLDEVAFKVRLSPIFSSLSFLLQPLLTILQEKLAFITPLIPHKNELPEKSTGHWLVNDDLKTLNYEGGEWTVSISCDSMVAEQEKQQFQVWGDIAGLGGLWKYYDTLEEDGDVELDVKEAEEEDRSS